MEEWKTFTLSAIIIIGTLALIILGKIGSDAWWQATTIAGGMYTARTVAKKLADSKNGK